VKPTLSRWVCCQIGAREAYSIPRALHGVGLLDGLVTDAWVRPPYQMGRLGNRYHPALENASVQGFNGAWLGFEGNHRLRKTDPWERMLARNCWFQRRAIAHLYHFDASHPRILFSYSYAARDLGRFAKQRGWAFVLGQMDPGRSAEQQWQRFPDPYWESWLEECHLADRILVNSDWSAQWLRAEGIAAEKLVVIPLVYEPPLEAERFQRQYPEWFSQERPLQVLFLGQAIARKGIHEVLQAAYALVDYPIHFTIVGAAASDLVKSYTQPNLTWVGAVPHQATPAYYQRADVFLFPTHSDGFGMTQLEAQAWRLPLIVSRHCGSVVQDQVNGLVLEEVSGGAIAQALLICLQNPVLLSQLSTQSSIHPQFRLAHLQQQLHHLSTTLSPPH